MHHQKDARHVRKCHDAIDYRYTMYKFQNCVRLIYDIAWLAGAGCSWIESISSGIHVRFHSLRVKLTRLYSVSLYIYI